MLKSEMQHQFWVTKKAVQRKFGSKEDDCIVSSDAELDAKIELFKSISESCGHLYRIIDHYQERLCILAQEENALGKFLKETGKNSNTTGKIMLSAGKAISYCGQQRMMTRPPLLRLFHEVEVFRGRAIVDTHATIVAMEKERTEYRAALSWMKSASNQLDPDTGRGLEKFRKSQTHVRLAKGKFDRLSLDCLQKIDLLAAARCNMFSHALVAYMSALLQFATKTSETFKATALALSTSPQYNFCILKDLTQASALENDNEKQLDEVTPIDSDQMLFFLDEFRDNKVEKKVTEPENHANPETKDKDNPEKLVEFNSPEATKQGVNDTNDLLDNLIDIATDQNATNDLKTETHPASDDTFLSSNFDDLVSLGMETPSFMPSQLLLADDNPMQNDTDNKIDDNPLNDVETESKQQDPVKGKSSILDFLNRAQISKTSSKTTDNSNQQVKNNTSQPKSKDKTARKDMSAWFQLFSELDPLANPDAMARKIDGGNDNSQAA